MKPFRSRSLAGRPALALWLTALAALIVGSPHTPADAGPCPGRYTVTPNTVFDNDTLLTWQRTTDTTGRTWADADSYCQNLSLDGGGWRLPSIFELQTLVDESVSAPALDPVAFNGANQNGLYWSGTLSAQFSNYAWYVDFGVIQPGGYIFVHMLGDSNRTRCVR